MSWFVIFACTVFGLYFWREHRVQQQDLRSASSPQRTGERYIGQVLTLSEGLRDVEPARSQRARRFARARHRGRRRGADRRPSPGLSPRPDAAGNRGTPASESIRRANFALAEHGHGFIL